jgi:hypothetical protein
VASPDPPGFVVSTQPNGSRFNLPLEGDLIEAALSLKGTTQTTAVFANYGVTDRWDVGLAVPFIKVNLDASVQARILRLVTCAVPALCNPLVHTFDRTNPDATLNVRHTGEASGLGDVVLRSKYQFAHMAGGGLAAAVDIRLPTGNEKELLGAGGSEAKFLLVASAEHGRFGQHVNFGYTAAHGTVAGTVPGLASVSIPDEINYSAGVELVGGPRLTVMGDVVGRTLRGAGRLDLLDKKFEFTDVVASNDPARTECGLPDFACHAAISRAEFNPRPGDLTLLLGTVGAKYNLAGNLLVSGSVLVPLTKAGLRSRVTTTVGIDYAF